MTVSPGPDQHQITAFLRRIGRGDDEAVDRLLAIVYEDLRSLAHNMFRAPAEGQTLQPTALVHEAYMRLVQASEQTYEGRKHFFRVAALAMRQLLSDHARSRAREKRGGAVHHVELTEDIEASGDRTTDVVALSEALEALRKLDERQADVVEMRFLVGLKNKEVAEILGVSERTVALDWTMARSWLERWMSK